MLNKIKALFSGRSAGEKSAAATFYPEKIVIATRNQQSEYVWYETDNLTLLPPDADNYSLGKTLLKHIEESQYQQADANTIKTLQAQHKKKAGFNSEKQTVINARYISIYLTSKRIRFEPFQNIVSKQTFLRLPEAIVEIEANADAETIGKQLRLCWEKCSFKD